MRVIMSWSALAIVLAAPNVGAQRFQEASHLMISAGNRVRIGVTDSVRLSPLGTPRQRLTGTVRGITADTLYLEVIAGSQPSAIPRALIQGVDLSLGPPSRRATAKEWGIAGGLYGGLLMMRPSPRRTGFENTMIGIAVGTSIGVLYGLVHPNERWRVAWLPE